MTEEVKVLMGTYPYMRYIIEAFDALGYEIKEVSEGSKGIICLGSVPAGIVVRYRDDQYNIRNLEQSLLLKAIMRLTPNYSMQATITSENYIHIYMDPKTTASREISNFNKNRSKFIHDMYIVILDYGEISFNQSLLNHIKDKLLSLL